MATGRTRGGRALAPLACCAALALAPTSLAHGQATGSLRVLILDPSGASVPAAALTIEREEDGDAGASTPIRAAADPSGWFVASHLRPGAYVVRVEAPGFEPRQVAGIRVGDGETRRTVRLSIARAAETVTVPRDPRTAALDPRGFSTFLSREQIDALPDDPDDFVRALRDLAPPGATLRVDGFIGGTLPPKSQILSIRIPHFDTFAAQDHGGLTALSFIDIITRPGGGRLQGSTDVSLRSPALNARHALASDNRGESLGVGSIAVDGPAIRGRASFSLAARMTTRRDTAIIFAAPAVGVVQRETVVQPQRTLTISGRMASALPRDQTLRVSFSTEQRTAHDLGVGGFTLRDRGYGARSSDTAIRAAVGGPMGRRGLVESRIQLHWQGVRSVSNSEAPAVRVLDAFSAGGAQVTGGSRSLELLAASDIDYARGPHAWRGGILLEAGDYRSNRRANYSGTFTFTSLEAYEAGLPAAFTRRVGDARIQHRSIQMGIYAQDDVRIARSLLLSYGLRYEAQTLVDDRLNLLPRAGITWSPFAAGHTTLRAGWGIFNDWLPREVYEQALAVDGVRQHDIHIPYPTYPDPGVAGDSGPQERYQLSPDLELPSVAGTSIGVEHRFTPAIQLYATYGYRSAGHRLRGENLNAPEGNRRPRPEFGNIIESRSDAGSRSHTVTVQAVRSKPAGHVDASFAYAFVHDRSNTAGPYSVPAAGRNPDTEWGLVSPAHTVTGDATVRAGRTTVRLTPRWRSGTPYTITTGSDDNGDGLFTDRAPGVPRQSGRTAGQWDVAVRVMYSWRFGPSREADLPWSAGADAQSVRAGTVAARGTGLDDRRRYRLEFFASAENVTNHTNHTAVSGVQRSPFFGQPTAAASPRRVDIGMRFGF